MLAGDFLGSATRDVVEIMGVPAIAAGIGSSVSSRPPEAVTFFTGISEKRAGGGEASVRVRSRNCWTTSRRPTCELRSRLPAGPNGLPAGYRRLVVRRHLPPGRRLRSERLLELLADRLGPVLQPLGGALEAGSPV